MSTVRPTREQTGGAGVPHDAAPGPGVVSIRWIVTGAAVALTAAAVVSVSAVAERNARRALTAEVEARLILDARNLALTGSAALLGDFPQ